MNMLSQDKIISWFRFRIYRLHLHFDLELVRRWQWRKYLAQNRLVLEIGPGGGPWTLELLQRNNTVTVVDVATSSLLRLKSKVERFPLRSKKVRLIKSHAADFSSREKYDQILLFDVLEHIIEDRRTIENLVRHLAPGGEILISVPRLGHIPIADECVSDREDGRHVRKGYSREDLERMLTGCGLTIIRRKTACGWLTRGSKAFSNRIYRLTRSRILFYLVRIASRPLLRLDFLRPNYPPYSLFLIAARRFTPNVSR